MFMCMLFALLCKMITVIDGLQTVHCTALSRLEVYTRKHMDTVTCTVIEINSQSIENFTVSLFKI